MSDGTISTTITRWRRYGHDRLYVTAQDGTKVGWCDLATGAEHPETPDLLLVLAGAVHEWRATQRARGAPDGAAADASVPPHPWSDLTYNRAGSKARAKAVEEREAAPRRTFADRVLGRPDPGRSWDVGAAGEERVGGQLVRLAQRDQRWGFLHAIPVGEQGADIDHLVVGHGGVFTLNAKHHREGKIWVGSDTVLVNGHRQPYVRNARHEAARASRLLTKACGFPVHVHGVVVPVGIASISVRNQPDGVSVVSYGDLVRWFLGLGSTLAPDDVISIFELARRSTTWRG